MLSIIDALFSQQQYNQSFLKWKGVNKAMYIAFGDKTWDTWRAGTRQVLFPVTDKAS